MTVEVDDFACVICGDPVRTLGDRCGTAPTSRPHLRITVARRGDDRYSARVVDTAEPSTRLACLACVRTAAGADLLARLVSAEVLRHAYAGGRGAS